EGPISAEVVIEIAPGVEVTSVITSNSVRSMGLKKGQKAYAVIKSDSVMVGVDH
ncbi:MAG TPA: TOBE domain-containing protein, partial [Pelomicrobium sp.]|nr:TOBE domain-containing protein [Pelomicrobium sp.]